LLGTFASPYTLLQDNRSQEGGKEEGRAGERECVCAKLETRKRGDRRNVGERTRRGRKSESEAREEE
jgi:hypothetical protein